MSSISQEQPLMAYPNTVHAQPQQQQQQQLNPNHSNGSFGTAFIVLGVIIVISAIACFLGRLCSRKSHSQKPKGKQPQKQNKIQPESHKFGIGPKEEDTEVGFDKMRSSRGGGMEFGFDKKKINKKEGGIELGFEKKRNPREGGIELGFEKRVPTARAGGVNGGDPKGSAFGPQ